MTKIVIEVGENGDTRTSYLKNNILVGWNNFSRAEQLALLKGMSENFEHGLKYINKE